MQKESVDRRTPTLSGELGRLGNAVSRATEHMNLAEDISSQLSGPYPVPSSTISEPDQPGQLYTLQSMIDALFERQDRNESALRRINDSLADRSAANAVEGGYSTVGTTKDRY